jgi:predicted nuclease with TOPRIM domain
MLSIVLTIVGIGYHQFDFAAVQELAKSTLLRALQRERNNVDELEAAVFTLQQNNSAISEMVESRDMLINELNDRVAVFEEDKVVLKAALRQLQNEMKDEAPRTQKLIDDLQRANEGTYSLRRQALSLDLGMAI